MRQPAQSEVLDRNALETELSEIDDQLRIYDTDVWSFLKERILREETKDLNAMMEATDPTDVLLKRERVKTLRHLGSDEKMLRRERARVVADLAALDEGE